MIRTCLLIVLAVAGCKDVPAAGKSVALGALAKADASHLQPIVTNSVTFFAPSSAPWWGEMSFACYAAAIQLAPGSLASTPITNANPRIAPALRAADIDLDRDVAAVGVFGCGDGACLYLALNLRHPDQLPGMISTFVPSATPTRVGDGHYSVVLHEAQPRTVHFQAVPIDWTRSVPSDPWSQDARKATHVLFISGIFGDPPLDPLKAAASDDAVVKEVERVVTDSAGMCIRGRVAARDFEPGYKLAHARFAMAAPPHGDLLTRLVGSRRTLDVEVELALEPAPTDQIVGHWISEASTFMKATLQAQKANLAAQTPAYDALLEIGTLLVDKGFTHETKGNALHLSWRTDRIDKADLEPIAKKLTALSGAASPSP